MSLIREKFGAHWVDFESEERTRQPKISVAVLQNIFENNGFPSNSTGPTTPANDDSGAYYLCLNPKILLFLVISVMFTLLR